MQSLQPQFSIRQCLLPRPHGGIKPVLVKQAGMRAAFFDLAIIENNDLISIGNRRQPVRNHHRCAVFGNLIKGGFDALFGARIKCRCGLI